MNGDTEGSHKERDVGVQNKPKSRRNTNPRIDNLIQSHTICRNIDFRASVKCHYSKHTSRVMPVRARRRIRDASRCERALGPLKLAADGAR